MTPGMKTLHRFVAFLTVLSAGAVLTLAQSAGETDVQYGKISGDGVHIRNLPDVDGMSIATPERGSLVRIHGELAGWNEVERPGGFAVWVFGRYLRPVEGQDGVWELTRNGVNIRPLPNSDVINYPLPQRLHAGDRVRVIELLDPAVDPTTTWMRIWSPPGIHAWVRSTDVTPLAPGADGAALWTESMATLTARVAPPYTRPAAEVPAAPVEAVAARDTAKDEAVVQARAALEVVRKSLEAEIEKPTPDLGAVRAELEGLLASAPSREVAGEVRRTIERLGLYDEVARVKSELQRERERRAEEARRRQREAWDASLTRDPLGHVFVSRGVLLRETDTAGTPRYRLRFGKEYVSEVVCASGRYDLDAYTGFEIGVKGETLLTTGAADSIVIDVHRLEVTARR